jgi:hypothetical protein
MRYLTSTRPTKAPSRSSPGGRKRPRHSTPAGMNFTGYGTAPASAPMTARYKLPTTPTARRPMHDNADYVALSDLISEKTGRLVDEHRVIFHYAHPYQGAPPIGATVAGDTDAYRVLIQEDRVWCPCPAWRPDRYCSHAASVMVAWKEMQDAKEASEGCQ